MWFFPMGRSDSAEVQIHCVAGLGLEINCEPGEDGIDRCDFSEAPTAMHAKSTRGELDERVNVVPFELAGGNHFFELFFHINHLKTRVHERDVDY